MDHLDGALCFGNSGFKRVIIGRDNILQVKRIGQEAIYLTICIGT